MVVMLRQCCCGCTLKTGTIIIGILNAIGAGYSFISGIIVSSATIVLDNDSHVTEDVQSTIDSLKAIMIVITVISGILFVVAICLIAGAVYGNPVLLLPWIIYTIIYTVVTVILYIVVGSMYISAGAGAYSASNFVSAALYLLLETYFILVVYSLYRELKGTAPGQPN